MRISAKRRAQWDIQFGVEQGDSRSILTRGGPIEVARFGRGEPILLIPGLAGGWRLVAPLARRLARDHEVIVAGLRGDWYPSPGPRPDRLADLAGDLSDVIETLRLERPTVFGVSFGGAVALELALGWPDRVGALVLHGVEARFQINLGSIIARRVLERFPLPTGNQFVNQFFNLLHGCKPEPGPLVDFVVERCWETNQSVIAHRIALLETFDVGDRLWRIEAPTLVLAGSRDAIVPPARQEALAASIAGARFLCLEGAGHIGFLTHQAEVARHVRRLVFGRRHSFC